MVWGWVKVGDVSKREKMDPLKSTTFVELSVWGITSVLKRSNSIQSFKGLLRHVFLMVMLARSLLTRE